VIVKENFIYIYKILCLIVGDSQSC